MSGAVEKARVLLVELNTDGTIGGSYFSMLYLAINLDRDRFEPIVYFSQPNGLMSKFQQANVAVHALTPRVPAKTNRALFRPFVRLGNFIAAKANLVRSVFRYRKILKSHKINLLHLNNSVEDGYAWLIAAKIIGIRCITHQRGFIRNSSSVSRWWARRFDAVICISDSVHENLERLGFGGQFVVRVHNGLDPNAIKVSVTSAAIRAELGIDRSQRVIGMVGNIQRWKGQDIVIRAISQLAAACPDLVCILVGAVSPTVPEDIVFGAELRSAISRLGLEKRVLMVGYRSNVADYINVCDILIHASVTPEPFGRVLLEAMAQSKPVIACKAGGASEIIVHGQTGMLYEPGDSDELARCIASLYADTVLCKALGVAGYSRLEADFSIEQNVRATMSIYDSVKNWR